MSRIFVKVSETDLQDMLICTLRYCMGRRSYIVLTCIELIDKYYHHLAAQQVEQYIKELRQALAEAGERNTTLGGEMDDRAWRSALERWERLERDRVGKKV